MNAECKRITASIPPYNIKGMMTIMQVVHGAFLFGADEKIPFLLERRQILRWTYIPLAIRRMFQQLSVLAEVLFRKSNRTKRFHDEQPVVLVMKLYLINGPAWNYQVIAIGKGQFAIHGTQYTRSFMYEDHFIGIGIFIKIIVHAFLRCGQYNMAIVVDQHRRAALQKIHSRL